MVPPRIAPAHVVILPIVKKDQDNSQVLESAGALKTALNEKMYHGRAVEVEIDDRDIGGARGWDWVKKGIPVRVELGPRDIAANTVFMARRDRACRSEGKYGQRNVHQHHHRYPGPDSAVSV